MAKNENDLVFVRTDKPQAQHDEVYHEADCPKLAQGNVLDERAENAQTGSSSSACSS